MAIEIEKGIPLRKTAKPLSPENSEIEEKMMMMEIDVDSIFVPMQLKPLATWVDKRRSRGHHEGRRFALRSVVKNGVKGVRIWRVK